MSVSLKLGQLNRLPPSPRFKKKPPPKECIEQQDRCGFSSYHLKPDYTKDKCYDYCLNHDVQVLGQLIEPPISAVFTQPQWFGLRTNKIQRQLDNYSVKLRIMKSSNGKKRIPIQTLTINDAFDRSTADLIDCVAELRDVCNKSKTHIEIEIQVRVKFDDHIPQDPPGQLVGWLWPSGRSSSVPSVWISNRWSRSLEFPNWLETQYTIVREPEKAKRESQKATHLDKLIIELMKTEFTYVRVLLLLIDFLIIPIEQRPDLYQSREIKELHDLMKISIEPLAEFHHAFLMDLNLQNTPQGVYDVLESYWYNTKPKTLYAVLYKNWKHIYQLAQQIVKQGNKNERQLLGQQFENGENFNSLFSGPISRVPRYQLLIQEMLKKGVAPKDEKQRVQLQRTLDSVKEVANLSKTFVAI